MNAIFTLHVVVRSEERLSLSLEEIALILNGGGSVPLGLESKRKNRIHRLFYSPPDCQCFVAIQDYRSGHLITVLPVDYHERICWRISRDAISAAMAMGKQPNRRKTSSDGGGQLPC